MSIDISAVAGVSGTTGTGYLDKTSNAAAGTNFASHFTNAVDNLQAAAGEKDSLAMAVLSGESTDVSAATIAATKSSTMLQLAAALKNKAVDGFNETLRMQA